MLVKCNDCGTDYDDAERLTFCPHARNLLAADMEQKKAALALLGKQVYFAHQPKGPVHRVSTIRWNGMVTLADMVGEFAPHIFVPATMDSGCG
jgi:hypothetical protein